MRNHLISVATGAALAIVGFVLWVTMSGVETPVIGLSQLGFVLLVLGGIEVVISGVALARSSTRSEKSERREKSEA